jgi:hypothetical protein
MNIRFTLLAALSVLFHYGICGTTVSPDEYRDCSIADLDDTLGDHGSNAITYLGTCIRDVTPAMNATQCLARTSLTVKCQSFLNLYFVAGATSACYSTCESQDFGGEGCQACFPSFRNAIISGVNKFSFCTQQDRVVLTNQTFPTFFGNLIGCTHPELPAVDLADCLSQLSISLSSNCYQCTSSFMLEDGYLCDVICDDAPSSADCQSCESDWAYSCATYRVTTTTTTRPPRPWPLPPNQCDGWEHAAIRWLRPYHAIYECASTYNYDFPGPFRDCMRPKNDIMNYLPGGDLRTNCGYCVEEFIEAVKDSCTGLNSKTRVDCASYLSQPEGPRAVLAACIGTNADFIDLGESRCTLTAEMLPANPLYKTFTYFGQWVSAYFTYYRDRYALGSWMGRIPHDTMLCTHCYEASCACVTKYMAHT